MNLDTVGSEAHTYEVDTVGADHRPKPADTLPLGAVDSVDGVALTGGSADLDDHPSPPIVHEQVDLTTVDDDVARVN
ncbi:MAG TPA: hypothetical protein VFS66_11435 [Acidimicrobiia bacterium]|nr:hypothetical protein [Acidimicrobiia bacterium]